MKRLLIFAALIVAIGAGGNIAAAHAQTVAATTATGAQVLTPAQIAALQQELAVAKATLANLEMEAGAVPPADAGTPNVIPPSIAGTSAQGSAVATAPSTPATSASVGLSATQISQFSTTLGTLAATLGQLNASIAANTTLTPSEQSAVQATLNGMGSTLVAMANTVANVENANSASMGSAPVATTQPSSPVAVNTAPSVVTSPSTAVGSAGSAPATTPATAPSAPVVAQTQPSTANTVPQTAQASSLWSFTKAHWPTIVIILLVIAILAILFWPEKETVRTVSTAGSGKPKSAPTSTATISQNTTSAPRPAMNNNGPSPATPVANAVAAPSQK